MRKQSSAGLLPIVTFARLVDFSAADPSELPPEERLRLDEFLLLLLLLSMLLVVNVSRSGDAFLMTSAGDRVLGEKKLVRERCCVFLGMGIGLFDVGGEEFRERWGSVFASAMLGGNTLYDEY